MNQYILKHLNNYSYETKDVNRLLISAFLEINSIKEVQNEFVDSYIISEGKELEELEHFVSLFNGEKLDIETLIELFEFVISPQDKEVNGAVFTPEYIRQYIVLNSIVKVGDIEIEELKFGDIACGCGGFFKTIAEYLKKKTDKSYFNIYRDNIYGLDIQEYSIIRTKILLCLIAISEGEDCKSFDFNLYCGNALDFDWNEVEGIRDNNGFDIIVGNPPYVAASKMDDETKDLLSNWSVTSTGKSDLYLPFFQVGIENLNKTGILGYITVNTFIKSVNGRGIRKYISDSKLSLSIIDFGGEQLFKGRSTYTCICIIGKKLTSTIEYINTPSNSINKVLKKDFIKIAYNSLDNFNGWSLYQKNIKKIIKKIESTGESLGQKFTIRNGFATLRNNVYLLKPIKESDEYYFFEQDGKKLKVEKGICKDAIKPNTLKSESQIVGNTEKLIFPYEFVLEPGLFQDEQRFIKIVSEQRLKSEFPYAYKYLASHKEILAKRDKGAKQYEQWYAYGRNQALTLSGYKLLFPYISSSPCFVFTENQDMLFYNGYAVISDSIMDLLVLQKILKSKIFWFYIKNTSKPYSGNYFSLAKNYVKNFGVCNLTVSERNLLITLNDKDEINEFLMRKYEIESLE